MKKPSLLLIAAATLLVFVQCNKEQEKPDQGTEMIAPKLAVASPDADLALQYFEPLPANFDNPNNPITKEKVYLGKVLYYDTQLSKTGNNSCNSCHNLSTFGVDNLPTSKGDNGGFGERNSPTVLNAALHIAQFWDGRAKDVEEQAGGPVLNPVEMAMTSEQEVVDKLKGLKHYPELFAKAFPGQNNPITYANLQNAIGAFERTLVTKSRFDQFMEGDAEALTEKEIKGMKTFVEVGCTTCHTGAGLGGNMYQKFGIHEDYAKYTNSKKIDEGKKAVTGKEADKFIFKVPSLRNIEKTYPYFHDGSVKDLGQAVQIMAKVQLGKDLSGVQISEIVAFLNTLTGDVPADAKKAPKEATL